MNSIKIEKQSVSHCSRQKAYTCEQALEAVVNLPEYFGEVSSVLCCVAEPSLNSVRVAAGRINAEGEVLIRIIYVSPEGRLYSYQLNTQFSRAVDAELDEGDELISRVRPESFICRAESANRLSIRGSVLISHRVFRRIEQSIVCNCEGMSQKKAELSLISTSAAAQKHFVINDSIELPSSVGKIESLLASSAQTVINDIKLISDKAMLTGDILLNLLYLSEGATEPQGYSASLPFTEVVDILGAAEGDICTARVSADSLDISTNTTARQQELCCYLKLSAELLCHRRLEVEAVLDAYSTEAEARLTSAPMSCLVSVEAIKESYTVSKEIDLGQNSTALVLDVQTGIAEVKSRLSEGRLILEGSINISILQKSPEGMFIRCERALDFEWSRPIAETALDCEFEPQTAIVGKSFRQEGNRLRLSCELMIEGSACLTREQRVVEQIELLDEGKSPLRRQGLIVYFAREGESLWDIAKHYNVPLEVLKSDNRLSEDSLDKKTTLLISCV